MGAGVGHRVGRRHLLWDFGTLIWAVQTWDPVRREPGGPEGLVGLFIPHPSGTAPSEGLGPGPRSHAFCEAAPRSRGSAPGGLGAALAADWPRRGAAWVRTTVVERALRAVRLPFRRPLIGPADSAFRRLLIGPADSAPVPPAADWSSSGQAAPPLGLAGARLRPTRVPRLPGRGLARVAARRSRCCLGRREHGGGAEQDRNPDCL